MPSSYQGYKDAELIDLLYQIEQQISMIDRHERAFIDNILDTHEMYNKVELNNKQRAFILSLRERYFSA